jgi:hypothetical protein
MNADDNCFAYDCAFAAIINFICHDGGIMKKEGKIQISVKSYNLVNSDNAESVKITHIGLRPKHSLLYSSKNHFSHSNIAYKLCYILNIAYHWLMTSMAHVRINSI